MAALAEQLQAAVDGQPAKPLPLDGLDPLSLQVANQLVAVEMTGGSEPERLMRASRFDLPIPVTKPRTGRVWRDAIKLVPSSSDQQDGESGLESGTPPQSHP